MPLATPSHSFGRAVARGLISLSIGILLTGHFYSMAGQTAPSRAVKASRVQDHFATAQEAQRNGNYVAAESEYRTILAVEPGFAEVHMNLGLVYQLQNHISDAMAEFRAALKLDSRLAGANLFLGIDLCKMGKGRAAIPYLKAATLAEPQRPDVWSWLATAQELSGETQAEVLTLQKALVLRPKDIDLLYLLGHAYEQLGRVEAAGLQKTAPGSALAERLLAESYATSSEWPTAVIHFQNALVASPGMAGLHVEMGEVFLRAGKLERAAQEFEEELRLHPGHIRGLVRRGEARLILGDVEQSLQDWAEAIDVDQLLAEQILGIRETGFGDAAFEQLPDTLRDRVQQVAPELQKRNTRSAAFALAFLAVQRGSMATTAEAPTTSRSTKSCSEAEVRPTSKSERFSTTAGCAIRFLTVRSPASLRLSVAGRLVETGDYETSLKVLSELSPPDRNSPQAFFWRARCYEKLATAAYLRLYQADSTSYRLHELLGDLYAAKQEDGKAIDEYRAAIALKPFLPNLHYSLGHLLWKDLRINEARPEFESELALNPQHAGALNELGDTYLLEHQPDKALPYLKSALAVKPGDPQMHRDLGTAYSELHRYREAEKEFKIALANDHDGSVHYKLARVYQALGEKEIAASEFDLSAALNRQVHDQLEKQRQRLTDIEKSVQNPVRQ